MRKNKNRLELNSRGNPNYSSILFILVLGTFVGSNLWALQPDQKNQTKEYLDRVSSNSATFKLHRSLHNKEQFFSTKRLQEMVHQGFNRTISELKMFFESPLFAQIGTMECKPNQLMSHLKFIQSLTGDQWIEVNQPPYDLPGDEAFKQELCFIKQNLHRFSPTIIVMQEKDDNCLANSEGIYNLEYVYARGNNILWNIFLCPQALKQIDKNAFPQVIRYISLHEIFHLVGLEHDDERPGDLMSKKLWLLNSFLYRPEKVIKNNLARRLYREENFRYQHLKSIGTVVMDPLIEHNRIQDFLNDQKIIYWMKSKKFTGKVHAYFKGNESPSPSRRKRENPLGRLFETVKVNAR